MGKDTPFLYFSLAYFTGKRTRQLNYSMIVNLKNGRITTPTPRLIQKVMTALGFDLHAKRVKKGPQFVVEFSLREAEQIASFHSWQDSVN